MASRHHAVVGETSHQDEKSGEKKGRSTHIEFSIFWRVAVSILEAQCGRESKKRNWLPTSILHEYVPVKIQQLIRI